VVRWRDANGSFKNRKQLMEVAGLGAKTFEQAAGFLRIRGGDNPLDVTGVHPETYPVVEQIIGHGQARGPDHGSWRSAQVLKPEQFANDKFGAVTIKDILASWRSPAAIRALTLWWPASMTAWKTSRT
jgi:uncharacterized protein